jgi:hypothetical protein
MPFGKRHAGAAPADSTGRHEGADHRQSDDSSDDNLSNCFAFPWLFH